MTGIEAFHWCSNDNPWRQGSVLQRDHAIELGILDSSSPADACVVVISHDCDIAVAAAGAEPDIEVLLGRVLKNPDPGLASTRSLRKLHLSATRDGETACIEVEILKRASLSKAQFENQQPCSSLRLRPESRRTLRRWLAARYARESFPNNFVARFQRRNLEDSFKRILEKQAVEFVADIYFKLENGEAIELPDDIPYKLRIVVSHRDGDDSVQSSRAASAVAGKLATAIEEACWSQTAESWTDIELLSCGAKSHSTLTLATVESFQVWRLENLTVRNGGAEPFKQD